MGLTTDFPVAYGSVYTDKAAVALADKSVNVQHLLAELEDVETVAIVSKETSGADVDVRFSARVFDAVTGTETSHISTALLVAAKALTQFGAVSLDRRDTVGFYLPDGRIIDTLLGAAGVSLDFGKWQMREQDNRYLVRTDAEYAVYFVPGEGCDAAKPRPDGINPATCGGQEPHQITDTVQIFQTDTPVKDSVGQARIVCYMNGVETPASGGAAAAAALVLRAIQAKNGEPVTHNWRIFTALETVDSDANTQQTPEPAHIPTDPVAVRMFPVEDGEHVSISAPVTMLRHENTCAK